MAKRKSKLKKVRLGVIGYGGMGAGHALQISQMSDVELTAVCDIDPERVQIGVDEYGCEGFLDYKKLLKADVCDAVTIGTPHYEHTFIGADALKAGYHVLVEKPISVHKADCERLIKAHTNKKLVFAAMFNNRTRARYQKIRQLVQSGELGELVRVNWIVTTWFRTQAYYDSGGWRATWAGEGGGVLLNQCPHELDLLTWFCGMPSRVTAFCGIGKRHHIEVEDEVTAYLEYPNGATGVFVTSTAEAPGTNRLEIVGQRAKLVNEGDSLTLVRNEIPADEFLNTSKLGFARPPVWNCTIPIKEKQGSTHRIILENFRDAILHGEKLIAPAEEGIHEVELGNAMLLSSLTGKPVDMPMNARTFERKLKALIKTSTFVKKVHKTSNADFAASFDNKK
jgi:predicted dehydrogenase